MRRVTRETGYFGNGKGGVGERGAPSATPLEPDPESLRTLRVTEIPQHQEVGGVGSCESSARCSRRLQMCLRSRDRTLLLPTPRPGAQVCKQSPSSPPSPPPRGVGLKARRPPPSPPHPQFGRSCRRSLPLATLSRPATHTLLPSRTIQVPHPRDGSGMTSFAGRVGGRGSNRGNGAGKAGSGPHNRHNPPPAYGPGKPAPPRPPRLRSSRGFLGEPHRGSVEDLMCLPASRRPPGSRRPPRTRTPPP